jgi:hypothetical protein
LSNTPRIDFEVGTWHKRTVLSETIADGFQNLSFQVVVTGLILVLVGLVLKGVAVDRSKAGLRRIAFWCVAPGTAHVLIGLAIAAVLSAMAFSINQGLRQPVLFNLAGLTALIIAAPALPIFIICNVLFPKLFVETPGGYLFSLAILDGFLWVAILAFGRLLFLKLLPQRKIARTS